MPADDASSAKKVNNHSGISKKNGFMKDSREKTERSKGEVEEIGKSKIEGEINDKKAKTDRRDSQHGASGMPLIQDLLIVLRALSN